MLFGEETTPAPQARDISNDVILQGKIRALQIFAAAITGETPQVINRGEYAEILFSPRQKEILQGWIKKSLQAGPSDIRIDYFGITAPPLIQVYGKIILVVLLAAFFLGRITK